MFRRAVSLSRQPDLPARSGVLDGTASRQLAGVLTALLALVLLPSTALAADSNGAGGSPVDQIAIATIGATIQTVLLLWLGLGHRSGKVKLLGRAAAYTERKSGIPGWAALPMAIATTSLLVAVFGMYWDIALHMGVGRDAGPLANPAHYFILYGLFGIFTAGYIAIVLPEPGRDAPGGTFVRISPTWHAPLGGVLICACGAFALIGFPLDDVWHRIFGQDVTLWGPTHLMLIGGASMTLIGIAVVIAEGLRANEVDGAGRVQAKWVPWARRVALSGGLLLGLSTFQAEFDFGIPQFRFVLEPVMLMVATGVGLVSTRIWGGKGSAIGAVAFFLTVRLILTVIVGPVLGEVTPMFPLYLGAAILVELVALAVPTTKPLRFGLVAGVALGTVGLATEWGWSQLVQQLPMPSSLLATGVPFGFAAAVGASLVGAWIGTRLLVAPAASDRGLRIGAVAGALVIAALFAVGLPKPVNEGQSATVALADVPIEPGQTGAGGRTVQATVTLDPPSAAKDNQWLTITAWQGGGVVVDTLREIGPGRYQSTVPIPVHGDWKAMIRLAKGRSLSVVPIHLPADTAIPAPEVAATASFTRPFVADHKVLQREQKPAAGLLTLLAYLLVGGITLLLLIVLVWGLHRLGTPPTGGVSRPRPARGALRRTPARSQPRSSAAEAG